MSASLESILGYVPLLEAIETILKGIPDVLPPAFMTTKQQVLGNTARYIVYTGTRQTARLSQYGSPAVKRNLRDIGSQDVVLMHSFEEISFNPIVLQQLRQYESYEVQKMGKEEVARQVGNFVQLFTNSRIAGAMLMLVNGQLWFDANGNLLPSSSGAFETISSQRSANNSGQLNGLITASWANHTTDIPLQLRNLKFQSRKDTGFEQKYALYGLNIPSYLTQNDFVIDYLSRNPQWSQKWNESAEIPDGLFGFTWVPMYQSFFDDQNAAHQSIWGNDQIVFTPEVDKRWWSIIEGSYPVPTTINIQTSAEEALNTLKEVFGMFGYSQLLLNPVSIATFMGDTWFPTLKNPAVTYAPTVNF